MCKSWGHPTPRRSLGRRRELTREERAYREARRAANRKIGFLAHAVPYAAVCVFLLAFSPRAALFVALGWGVPLACHFFLAIVAPRLRRRLIDDEVRRRARSDFSHERRVLEGEHARRLEELSASIAHEIRNPVTAAKSLVQQMGEDTGSPDNVEYAKVALDELDRVEKSVSHLLRFAREEELELRDVLLTELVESAVATFRDRIPDLGADLEIDVPAATALRADPDKLRRILINLIRNALDACGEGAAEPPRVSLQAGDNLAGTAVWIRVKDNGPGIEDERLSKIFSPFYTSKSSGTGLGLAISKKLVEAHGGSLEAHSQPGTGSEFLITLPKHQPRGPE